MKTAESDALSAAAAGIVPPSPAGDDLELGTRVLLGFVVGTERYALPLSSVREILRLPQVTEVPRAPKDVVGVFSVRGTVTTLIDTRARLNVPAEGRPASARILLVDQGTEVIGLLVDAVLQVYRLRQDEVELALSLGSDAPAYIVGIGRPRALRDDSEQSAAEARHEEMLVLVDPIALLKS